MTTNSLRQCGLRKIFIILAKLSWITRKTRKRKYSFKIRTYNYTLIFHDSPLTNCIFKTHSFAIYSALFRNLVVYSHKIYSRFENLQEVLENLLLVGFRKPTVMQNIYTFSRPTPHLKTLGRLWFYIYLWEGFDLPLNAPFKI